MSMLPGRLTKERDGKQWVFPVSEGAVITLGAMVALNAAGEAVPAAAAAGLTVVGVAEDLIDRGGQPWVKTRRGCFAFDAGASGAPSNANVGKPVYVADAVSVSTVADNGSSSSLVSYPQAGVLLGVDDDGCWVKM
jgi:hypothetical protein